jgi:hypothetical protein
MRTGERLGVVAAMGRYMVLASSMASGARGSEASALGHGIAAPTTFTPRSARVGSGASLWPASRAAFWTRASVLKSSASKMAETTSTSSRLGVLVAGQALRHGV